MKSDEEKEGEGGSVRIERRRRGGSEGIEEDEERLREVFKSGKKNLLGQTDSRWRWRMWEGD